MSQTRRLAAILAADVAGYSRLMGADEEGTHERLNAQSPAMIRTSCDPDAEAMFFWFGPEGAKSVDTPEVAPGIMLEHDPKTLNQKDIPTYRFL
jgi:hypothetical protein